MIDKPESVTRCNRLTARMQKFKDAGLIGCFNGTGVNSSNYKEVIMSNYRDFIMSRKCEKCGKQALECTCDASIIKTIFRNAKNLPQKESGAPFFRKQEACDFGKLVELEDYFETHLTYTTDVVYIVNEEDKND